MKKTNKRHEEHEEHADESWLLPYSDLMTLLLALFITLFSMSSVDAKKFEEMSQALSSALNGGTGVLDHTSSYQTDSSMDLGKNTNPAKNQNTVTDAALAKKEQEDLEKLKKQLDDYIDKNGLTKQLDTKLNQSQLMITIADNALFASGAANVKPEAKVLAKNISRMLEQFPSYDVIVTGHTDNMPISNNEYTDNWDLSSDRALNFLKIVLQNSNLDPSKFTPSGFGEYHPVASNSTAEGRAQNRRVEISIIRKYTTDTKTINSN
ncbi:flagellar motor protein MotB [Paenibacillus sp. Marseille-Q4541]|uniref:flagellar motor protein MotB n=1 Tax=Paenibacillus sp. Marseille-Q4541 TaxID=2831522 RepID=UPI001BAC7B94